MDTLPVNRLILGDNLEVLKTLENDSVDLVYLDPPFFSNRTYEVIWGDAGEVRSFQDRWEGGIEHYIGWLKERVEEMHRVLKPTGSIFLHCDWHAQAYIRVGILDKIFGEPRFRNQIIWCYKKWSGGKNQLTRNHDLIWWYSKTDQCTYNQLYGDRAESTLKRFGTKRIISGDKNERGKRIPSRIAEEDSIGVRLADWWEISIVAPSGNERIGYPTQKPIALLERIITCASNEGDLVLDPFMGGGTTIAAADKLNRRWVGIDQSPQAVKVTEYRLNQQQKPHGQGDMFYAPFTVQLHKYDHDTLRNKDAFEFESWIITQFGGRPQNKKGGDQGIDGKAADGAPIQVKRSDGVSVNVVKNFWASLQGYDKALCEKNRQAGTVAGYIIAFSFGKGAVEEAARLKNSENLLIRLVKVEEIVPISQKPTLAVHVGELSRDAGGGRELECTACGKSDAGIEFYSWDFDHDPERGFRPTVILDKTGCQRIKRGPGEHTVAVKVVDNEGLENIEVVKLKINGGVERLG